MAVSYFTTLRELVFLATHPALWGRKSLELDAMLEDPFDQFEQWYQVACKQWFAEFPNAMILSTVSQEGQPEGRVVLMKGRSKEGIVFYTNKESQKGQSLEACPQASVTFYWGPQQRQIRIAGTVKEVSSQESDKYFQSRPRGSQIGAWASNQSRVLTSREELLARVRDFEQEYAGREVPRPRHWGGYRLVPHMYEFWELRLSRLHDRIRYIREEGKWTRERLSP